jgi:hypothetical protein
MKLQRDAQKDVHGKVSLYQSDRVDDRARIHFSTGIKSSVGIACARLGGTAHRKATSIELKNRFGKTCSLCRNGKAKRNLGENVKSQCHARLIGPSENSARGGVPKKYLSTIDNELEECSICSQEFRSFFYDR